MAQQHALTLRVNDRYTLFAGSWQTERDEQHESFRLVSSPEPPMYFKKVFYWYADQTLQPITFGVYMIDVPEASWYEPGGIEVC